MQNGVFDSARVLINRHPVINTLLIEWLGWIVGARIAQEIPGGVDKGVHRVRLPPRRLAALRTGRVDEGRRMRQRVLAIGTKFDLGGEAHR